MYRIASSKDDRKRHADLLLGIIKGIELWRIDDRNHITGLYDAYKKAKSTVVELSNVDEGTELISPIRENPYSVDYIYELLTTLVAGIEFWAKKYGGVHKEAYEPYKNAIRAINKGMFIDEKDDILLEIKK